ncbi:MAG: hypothetical protein QOH96_466 [Blastocatellia bacterium]|jgi:hypothetical protein|nr:hypothetical protein [Blastocatellia bacterium]
MKRRLLHLATAVMFVFVFASFDAFAQNSNSTKGQVKESGSEVGKAGKSLGHNLKHGRVLRGGKYFGKHMGRAGKHVGGAGKHVGRGTKKVVKRAVS